jgi:hypothetical protein
MTKWREATKDDYPAILKCHQETEQKVGHDLDLPPFNAPSMLIWMVAEREEKVVQFFFIERCVELRLGGSDVEALQELIKESRDILHATKAAQIRYLHCCVPEGLEEQIGRHLKKADIHRSENVLFAADLR